MAKFPNIKSADGALKEAQQLKAVWSEETLLILRVVIYCASLLERILIINMAKKKP